MASDLESLIDLVRTFCNRSFIEVLQIVAADEQTSLVRADKASVAAYHAQKAGDDKLAEEERAYSKGERAAAVIFHGQWWASVERYDQARKLLEKLAPLLTGPDYLYGRDVRNLLEADPKEAEAQHNLLLSKLLAMQEIAADAPKNEVAESQNKSLQSVNGVDTLVDFEFICNMVLQKPNTFRKHKKLLGAPDYPNSGTRPDKWLWSKVLPKLRDKFPRMQLPEKVGQSATNF